jgi:hypothetical protein
MLMMNFLYSILLIIVGLITLFISLKFLLARKFFPYHSQASELKWEQVDNKLQLVILAIMKMAGAAILLLGLSALAYSIYHLFVSIKLLSIVIPITVTIFWLFSFFITFYVYQKTKAKTPWNGSLLCLVLSIICLVIGILI